MRKILFFIPLLFAVFCLTSCVDYVQSITYKDGKYQMYYKITVAKTLLAITEQDPDELFGEFDSSTFDDLPESVDFNKIDDEIDAGIEIRMAIDPHTDDTNEMSFLPKTSGKKCYIPFLLGDDDLDMKSLMSSGSDDEYAEMAQLMMSSSKCRVLISKKVISAVDYAYFEARYGFNYVIPVYDYGESYCLEIPFLVFFEDGDYNLKNIVVVKK